MEQLESRTQNAIKICRQGILGIVMGATSLIGSLAIPPQVSGDEGYIQERITDREPMRVAYAQRHNLSYEAMSKEAIVTEAQIDRETGLKVAHGMGYALLGAGALALLAGLYRKKVAHRKGDLQ